MQTSRDPRTDVWPTEIKRKSNYSTPLPDRARPRIAAVESRLAVPVPICTFTAATANFLCCNCSPSPRALYCAWRMAALSHFRRFFFLCGKAMIFWTWGSRGSAVAVLIMIFVTAFSLSLARPRAETVVYPDRDHSEGGSVMSQTHSHTFKGRSISPTSFVTLPSLLSKCEFVMLVLYLPNSLKMSKSQWQFHSPS